MSAPDTARILVVDDERANRKLLGDLVLREGAEAVLAAGGEEALAILEREAIDLVLLDIMMPGVDGLAVLGQLQKRGALPLLPVVVVTAHEDRKVRIEALTAGAIDFLTKPIDRLEVACKIRTLLELRTLRNQAREQATLRATAELSERIHQSVRQLPLYVHCAEASEAGCIVPEWVIGDVQTVLGLSPEQFLARPDGFESIHPDDREEVARTAADVLAGRSTSWRTQYRVLHPTRGHVWVQSVGTFDRERGRLMGAALDISAEKSVEEALVQSRKMDAVGKLAGGVAHDFNNILAVILSYGDLVREALPEDDPVQADLLEVRKAAERGVGLTRQLLSFSRQQPITKQSIDLNERLLELRGLLSRAIEQHIELSVIPAVRPAMVRIDPVQFDQIVLNLAVNARDAMPQGGRLTITLEAPDDSTQGDRTIRLRVVDGGAGMDERTQARIFEPFFTTKPVGKGTGLGLATCLGIVQEAGGKVRVSSSPGAGTTFTIDLPAASGGPSAKAPSPTEAAPGGGAQVLVVEDEPALLGAIVRLLEGAGYLVASAADGSEAKSRIDALGDRLDLILTDVVLPGCSGYQVAEHAARVGSRAAVLFTSGFPEAEASRRARREGAIVLPKPVSPRDLAHAVGDALRRSARSASG